MGEGESHMSAPKFTPGPHTYIPGACLRDENNEEFEADIIATSDAVLATFSYYDGKPAHANGELWAAASDLYAALDDALNAAAGASKSCGHDYSCICTWDNARAALAKARGEK